MNDNMIGFIVICGVISIFFAPFTIIEPLHNFLKELRKNPNHSKKHLRRWAAAYFLFWPLTIPLTIILFIPFVCIGTLYLFYEVIGDLLLDFKPLYYETFPSKKLPEPGITKTGPYR